MGLLFVFLFGASGILQAENGKKVIRITYVTYMDVEVDSSEDQEYVRETVEKAANHPEKFWGKLMENINHVSSREKKTDAESRQVSEK